MLIALIILALAALGVWYWLAVRTKPLRTNDVIKAVTAPVSSLNIQSNPVKDKLPDLNPVSKTNPFINAYHNPFQ